MKGCTTKAILHFQCSEETMISRVLGRATTSGRIDDNAETFRKRYRGFKEEISEIIPFFGKKVVKVVRSNCVWWRLPNEFQIDCEPPLTETYEATKELVKVRRL